jgi:hypothetical protein
MSEKVLEHIKAARINVAFFPFDDVPKMVSIDNKLEAMQTLVEGRICLFETRIPGVIGYCNDDSMGIWGENILCRPFGNQVCGPFFLCAEVPSKSDGWIHVDFTDAQKAGIEWCCSYLGIDLSGD